LWSGLELKQPGKRLKSVRTRLAFPLSAGFALILSTSWATTSLAQTTEPDGPIAMEASAGLANYVDGRGPVDLAVTISADVLFAGNLEVRQTASLIMVPVEVPAG
jgi:hypothetical protein